jgi:excisionase family DNA binding protein
MDHDKMKPNLLLNRQEAARTLAISQRSLWTRTASGEIPHLRIGRSVRYRLSSLEAYLSEKEEESNAGQAGNQPPPR